MIFLGTVSFHKKVEKMIVFEAKKLIHTLFEKKNENSFFLGFMEIGHMRL